MRSSSFVPWRTSEAIEGRITEGETFQNLKNFGSLKNVSKCTCSLVLYLLSKKNSKNILKIIPGTVVRIRFEALFDSTDMQSKG